MMEDFNSAVFGQFNRGNPTAVNDVSLQWLQTPPASLPWVLSSNQYPDIVQFSAPQPAIPAAYAAAGFPYQPVCPTHTAKRKSDSTEEVPCPKKLITEEKISGLLKDMHITQSSSMPEQGNKKSLSTDFINEAYATSECPKQQLKRLVLCEEIRQFKSEPILPSSLLSKLSATSMSLVLWKPPAGDLSEVLKQAAAVGASTSNTSAMSMDTEVEDEEPHSSISEMQ